MILHDLFDWSNAGVGVVGLVFTLWAVKQATGAKNAARDARQAVYRRNAADDMARISRLASGLLTAIETRQDSLALHISRDFISDCPNIREHHRVWLGSEGCKLDVASGLARRISEGIQSGKQQEELIESAQRIVVDISGLVGVLSREIEKEGQ